MGNVMSSASGGVRAGRAFIELSLRTTALQRGLKQVEAKMRSFASSMQRVATTAFAMGSAITAPLVLAVKLASDAQESMNRFNATFRDGAASASKFAEALAAGTGRGAIDLKNTMAVFQGFFGAGGTFDDTQLLKMSKAATQLAVDLSSFQDISLEESTDRINSGLAGSVKALSVYGIALREANINQKLLEQGVNKTTATASESEKFVARLALITEQMGTRGAVGDAVRTANDFSNALRGVISRAKELGREIGNALIPALEDMLPDFRTAFQIAALWVKANDDLVRSLAGVAAGLIGLGMAAGTLGLIASGMATIVTAVSTVAGLLATLFGGPIVLGGVVALTVAVTALGKQLWDIGKAAVSAVKSIDDLGQLWKEVSDAMMSGDSELALQTVMVNARIAMLEFMSAFQTELAKVGKSLDDIVKTIKEIPEFGGGFLEGFKNMFLLGGKDEHRGAIKEGFNEDDAFGRPRTAIGKGRFHGRLVGGIGANGESTELERLREQAAGLREQVLARLAENAAELNQPQVISPPPSPSPPRLNERAMSGTAALGSTEAFRFLRKGEAGTEVLVKETQKQTNVLQDIKRLLKPTPASRDLEAMNI